MAQRKRKGRAKGTWWTVALLALAAGLLVWWVSARRAEAPGLPASLPGARAIAEPPDSPNHAHDEITGEEKADLERIIRSRGAATPPR